MSTAALPRWDMTPIFPSLESPEFQAAYGNAQRRLDEVERSFDAHRVDKNTSAEPISAREFEAILGAFDALADDLKTIRAYIDAFETTDSRDEVALSRSSEFNKVSARFGKLRKRLTAWIGSSKVEELLGTSEVAVAHKFFIERCRKAAEHQMEPELEAFASDMELTGSTAWERLYSNITSQLEAPIALHGQKQSLPMSAIRALAHDPDREVRRAAYDAELAAWPSMEVPIAAAMNSIKGEVLTLAERRKWGSPLDEAMFYAHIDRAALDAMMDSAKRSFPDFRRYLHLKAKALGLQRLAFYDLFAPLPGQSGDWDYPEATRFVAQQFRTYSERMGLFAERSFDESWIDAEPRPGKVDGAYCMGVRKDESRILMNYKPAFGSVSTLAHELGHAYHNLCLNGRTSLQRRTPMTLAETASIFCETIVRQATLATGSKDEKLQVLEASLQGSCQVVVDISSRFLFEQAVFEARASREINPSELCEMMVDAQKKTYGDGLDESALHPYMWAAKPHYYGASFYNFPYMFGLLFGLGLYSVYRAEGEPFKARYDDLLSSTGLDDAAGLARRFGIDIRSTEFWDGSFALIRGDIDAFASLVTA